MYVPDSQLVQDDDEMDNSGKMGGTNLGGEETTQPTLSAFAPHVSISTTKVNGLKLIFLITFGSYYTWIFTIVLFNFRSVHKN